MKKNVVMKVKFPTLFLITFLLFAWFGAAAGNVDFNQQAQHSISGQIVDDQQEPLPGVTVSVEGTTVGTVSDIDGNYSLRASEDAVLIFSFIGFATERVEVEGRSVIDMSMTPDILEMEEVVVTALGIKRDRKALGYSLQEIGGEALLEARETNVANSLSGRISGLQVIRSSSGPASSSQIVLRGNSSLTGDNQPLIVVDGVPIDNFAGVENTDYWNPSADMGSGLNDINPEDIESMSVLKGASAAALYGSRAGNGVILIETKRGRQTEGLGITVSSSLGIQNVLATPDMQSSFGQGSQGIYNYDSGSSWGPRIEGQTVQDWEDRDVTMRYYDNVDNYFDTGINQNYNISFQQQINSSSLYASFTRTDDRGVIPGAELERNNLNTRFVSVFGPEDRWELDTKVQFIQATATNRPILGHNDGNPFRTMYLLPVSMDVRQFSDAVDELGEMTWYGTSSQINPYWARRYNTNEDTRDRFVMHAALSYDITDWMSAEIRAGSDRYTTNTESRVHAGSPLTPTGRFEMGKDTFFENNFSALITAGQDNVIGDFGFSGSLGANLMEQQWEGLRGSSGQMEVPNLFSLNNAMSQPEIDETFRHKKINSIYGTGQVNYAGYLFFDATFRNDWSSSLHPDNQSYFYPSFSTSWVITDMINHRGGSVPFWLTFARVRASYAEVGNDLAPYELYNTYSIDNDPFGNATADMGDVLYDESVRSELIKSYELGAEAAFFQNRLGFDFSWYRTNATRQLINLPMDPMSGFSSRKINAGDIQNEGVELEVYGTLLDERSAGIGWDMRLNYSYNRNTIEELAEGVTQYQLGGFDNLRIVADVGGNYGEIYGTQFQRVEDEESQFYGQKILDSDGLPLGTTESHRLGSQQPDALVGLTNTFTYRGLRLSMLLDARIGGEMFSGTNHAMQSAGTAAVTAPGGEREDMVVEGVIDTGEGYVANDREVTQQLYWERITGATGNLGINEANVYDATNIRLRTIALEYNIPARFLGNAPIQNARVGASANNVWLIDSKMNGVDPESVFATGTNAVGFENTAPPTSRSFMFNLTLGF
ncbi:SusC/RagA family TonB-linked outer membrane protein [Marinilabiliaceae bacterium ANBcel2]|nr:SusC/RagA family TonB-linked outer membrane protein [Marinilabiliaceae bacterium ANBcel2]